MKKIYSFIVLLLMCFVGTANAQDVWEKLNEENVAEIQEGVDYFYAISGADNTKYDENGNPVQGANPQNLGKYMTGTSQITEIKSEAVWHFIKVADHESGLPVYVLQNVANGLYLANNDNNRFTEYKTNAFRFTAQKGVLKAETDINAEGVAWEDYSNAVSNTRSVLAEDKWVFCNEKSKVFMCFYGNPAFAGYIDTNNWNVYEVKKAELPIYAKLQELYNEHFPSSVSPEIFPVGENPGCISEEFYQKMYNLAQAIESSKEGDSEAELQNLYDQLVQVIEDLKTEIKPVGPGFFIVRNIDNQERGFLTVTNDGKKGHGDKSLKGENDYATWTPEMVTAWNLQNAKFIWQVETAQEKGRLYFKNFATGKYLSANEDFTMNDNPKGGFLLKNYKQQEFYFQLMNNKIMHVANHSNNQLMTWNADDPASRFQFYAVDQKVIDSLSAKVEQNAIMKELSALVKEARNDLAGVQVKNGFVEDGFYNYPTDSGLVDSFIVINSFATNEGQNCSKTAAFDGKLGTYFHTAWSKGDVESQQTEGSHWVKIDLGKEVSSIVFKFSKRQGAANGHISKYSFYTINSEADLQNAKLKWSKPLYTSADSIMYSYADSTTHIDTIQFAEKARYILFDVDKTRGRDAGSFDKMTEGTGPMWHCSEMRFYDAAECVPNPKYTVMSEEAKSGLATALKEAQQALEDSTATKEIYSKLETALDNFWKAYPGTDGLKEALEGADKLVKFAVEKDGIGFFKPGSKQAFTDAVAAIAKEVEDVENAGKALTLDKIKELEAALDKAKATFNASLQVPEGGKFYRIASTHIGENNEGVPHAQTGAYVMSVDADSINGTPRFTNKYDDLSTRMNTLWYVEKKDGKFSFRNVANGLYMDNVYDGLTEAEIDSLELPDNKLGYSNTPKYFTFESFAPTMEAAQEGNFVLALKNDSYVNFQGDGTVMVRYYDRDDQNAPLRLELVDVADLEPNFKASVQPAKVQILSFPFAINAVYTNDADPVTGASAYQVLGIKGGKMHLAPIESTIKAGTPFIIKTVAEENIADLELVDTPDALFSAGYVYDKVEVNGLVASPVAFKAEEGFGYLVNDVVLPTEKGTWISAASGFFNKNVPAYNGEDGALILDMEGSITGEGLAVENVEIVKNVANDVYTVSGVKVRSNVKAGEATKNLPKGVYIVGGKKVIVK